MDGSMTDLLDRSRILWAAGLLRAVTGAMLLLAVLLAPVAAAPIGALSAVAGSLGTILTLLGAALLLLAARLGLLLQRAWGWYLALLVAVSGALVVLARLLADSSAWPALLPPLITDLLLLVVLVWERPRRRAQPAGAAF